VGWWLIVHIFPLSHFVRIYVSQLGKDAKTVIQILYWSLLCVLLLTDCITMSKSISWTWWVVYIIIRSLSDLHGIKISRMNTFLCLVDREFWIKCILTNTMHCLCSVYWVITPLHVSGASVAHHQEVECLYVANGTVQLTDSHTRWHSTQKYYKYHLPHTIYSWF
jgi:hypothetical protein